MPMGVATVAKKAGRPAKSNRDKTEPRRIIMLVTPEYDDWLERRAVQLRTTKSGAIDRMVSEWATQTNTESPPARITRE